LLFTLILPCFADSVEVYLKNYVYDWSGQPIKNATVSLKRLNLSATTDSLGSCIIDKFINANLPVKQPLLRASGIAMPQLKSDGLYFSISGIGLPVKVSLFSLSGKKIGDVCNTWLGSGDYRISPFLKIKSAQAYVLHARIGDQVSTYKLPFISRHSVGFASVQKLDKNSSSQKPLKKALLHTQDSIVVSAANFAPLTRPIDSIVGSHYFSLHAPGASVKYLDVTFSFVEISQVAPSYLTTIWLEDANKNILQTLFACGWLSTDGYRQQSVSLQICPDWLGSDSTRWATQRRTNQAGVDAVTRATPITGSNSLNAALGSIQGAVKCCIETHIESTYNILFSASIDLSADSAEGVGAPTYVPSRFFDPDALSLVKFKLHK
jgi:hypothetical protein